MTSLLSRLCQLPHPHLHEYLLNPTLPLTPGARSMHSVLRSVLAKAKQETSTIQQLNRKVYVCRKTLLGSQADRAGVNLTPTAPGVLDGLFLREGFQKEVDNNRRGCVLRRDGDCRRSPRKRGRTLGRWCGGGRRLA